MRKITRDFIKELKLSKRPIIIGIHIEASPAVRRQGMVDEANGTVRLRHLWDK